MFLNADIISHLFSKSDAHLSFGTHSRIAGSFYPRGSTGCECVSIMEAEGSGIGGDCEWKS